ncbi:MAG TPA: ABC transporter permease [Opitutaceae bacterium]|nr:ABC transporter permease [Opitutaceae bacterium]
MRRTPAWILWTMPVLSGAVFIALWYGLKAAFGISDWLLPTPLGILAAMGQEMPRLLPAAGTTALGALGGFLVSAALGFLLALPIGVSRVLRAAFYPWLLVAQMTPIIVLTPAVVIWSGGGFDGIIAVTVLISFFPIIATTTQGLLSTDQNLVALFRMANATTWQELWQLRVPSAMPHYLTGLKIAAALAPIGAIFAEYMVGNSAGGTGGLGFLVYRYHTQVKIPAVFATGLTSCLLGFIFVAAVSLLNWAVLHKWHDSFERDDH